MILQGLIDSKKILNVMLNVSYNIIQEFIYNKTSIIYTFHSWILSKFSDFSMQKTWKKIRGYLLLCDYTLIQVYLFVVVFYFYNIVLKYNTLKKLEYIHSQNV